MNCMPRWMAMRADEQAVSKATDGPFRSNVYEIRLARMLMDVPVAVYVLVDVWSNPTTPA